MTYGDAKMCGLLYGRSWSSVSEVAVAGVVWIDYYLLYNYLGVDHYQL